jgi:hypothetical protein
MIAAATVAAAVVRPSVRPAASVAAVVVTAAPREAARSNPVFKLFDVEAGLLFVVVGHAEFLVV